MNSLKIALLQIMPGNNIEENRRIGEEACRKAKLFDADIALFPEMWSCGYSFPENPAELEELAVNADGEFVSFFGNLAAELDMAVGITFLEKHSLQPRNTLRLFDRHGKSVLTYAKVHTCDFGDEKALCPGDDFYVCDLDTKKGIVETGAMICYDREFPESARILMLKGAEVILVPNACPMEINRLSQLRARAYENMCAVATANYPGGKPDCNGHSSAFDGIAYRPKDSSSRDTLIVEAGEGEGIYIANINLDELRDYRNREVHGNAYRHPKKYSLLTKEEIRKPFIRKDYRE